MNTDTAYSVTFSRTSGSGEKSIKREVTATFPDPSVMLLISARLWQMVDDQYVAPDMMIPSTQTKP